MPHKDPEARQAYLKQWAAANPVDPSKKRENHLLRTYGIALEEYEEMLADQGGGCGQCGATHPGGKLTCFRVDHCHETGVVRGLLCQRCNLGLGYLGDNLAGLQSAVHYLSKSEPTLFPGIWKRIAPKISSSISAPFDPEMQNGCSDSRSLREMVPVFTVVPKTTSLSTT